jgi:hypothetical protein
MSERKFLSKYSTSDTVKKLIKGKIWRSSMKFWWFWVETHGLYRDSRFSFFGNFLVW